MSISARTYSSELADCSKRTVTDQLPTLRAVTEVHTVLTSKCSTVHRADPQSPTNDKMLKHTLTVSADVYECPIILLSAVYSGVYCNI
jgi:hypothetical protein